MHTLANIASVIFAAKVDEVNKHRLHRFMPKRSPQEGLAKTVAFRVTSEDAEAIAAAMRDERRTESDVCRALLGRGIAAYKRDRQIFEPEPGKVHIRLPVPKPLKTR